MSAAVLIGVLAGAGAGAPAQGDVLELRIRTPLDGHEVEALNRRLDLVGPDLGVRASALRIQALRLDDLAGDTLLFGYEVSSLRGLERDGHLAGAPEAFARESWAPVASAAPGEAGTAVASWDALFEPPLAARVIARRRSRHSPETLVLAALAVALGRDDEALLPALQPGHESDGTLEIESVSFARLLRELEPGEATFAPVRAAVAAQERGAALVWGRPAEGFVALELAVALSGDAGDRAKAWFASGERDALVEALREAAALEPLGVPPRESPLWQQRVAAAPLAWDAARAEALRDRFVHSDADSAAGGALAFEAFDFALDMALIAAGVAAVFWFARSADRGRRDRGSGPLV